VSITKVSAVLVGRAPEGLRACVRQASSSRSSRLVTAVSRIQVSAKASDFRQVLRSPASAALQAKAELQPDLRRQVPHVQQAGV
jgi:hypothetical protein